MKGRSLSIIGIMAAVVGAILIICYKSINVAGVTITGGILFVGVGLVNLLFFSQVSKNENAAGRALTLVSNAAAIVLGLSMLVFKATFAPMITFIFGLLVAVCALWQFFVLAIGTRPYQLPIWLYIFPVLIAAGSVYLFMRKAVGEDALLMMGTGVSLAILGVACIIEGSALGMARRQFEKNQRQQQAPGAQTTPVDTTATPVTPTSGAVAVSTDAPVQAVPLQNSADLKPVKRPIETTDDLDDESAD